MVIDICMSVERGGLNLIPDICALDPLSVYLSHKLINLLLLPNELIGLLSEHLLVLHVFCKWLPCSHAAPYVVTMIHIILVKSGLM